MTTATPAPKLLSTRDYEKFELHPQNRDVSGEDRLRKSMKRYGYLPQYPIHCTPNGTKLKIKSGHHRFTVARELGLPVYYVLADDGDVGIHELEAATRRWTLEDYLTSFVREGRGYYAEVKAFYRRTGMPLSCCVAMLGGESAMAGGKQGPFKSGSFRVTPAGREHAEWVERLVKAAERGTSESFIHTKPFIGALSCVLFVAELDREELERRLEKYGHLLEECRHFKEYVAVVEKVYNHAARELFPLAFMAQAVARSRRVAIP